MYSRFTVEYKNGLKNSYTFADQKMEDIELSLNNFGVVVDDDVEIQDKGEDYEMESVELKY